MQFYVSTTMMSVKTPATVLRATDTCYQNFVGPVFPVNMVAQFFEYTWWPSFPVHMGGVITFSGTHWWQIARTYLITDFHSRYMGGIDRVLVLDDITMTGYM